MRSNISSGLYIFTPFSTTISLFLRRFFQRILSVCMACTQERLMMARRWYICCMKFRFLGLQCYAGPNLSVVYFTNRDRSPHDLHRMTLPMILRIASRCSLLNLAKFSFNPFVHLFRLFDFFWSDWQRINWIKSSKFSNLLERFKYSSSLSPFFQVHTIQIICMKIKSEIPQPNWHYTV